MIKSKREKHFRMLVMVMVWFGMLTSVQAQRNVHLGADVVSHYVWRGLLYSPTPNIQPSITYTSSNGNFSLGTWGSYGIGSYFGEVDVFASFQVGGLSLTLSDYFVMPDVVEYEYFNFKKKETLHAVEFSAVWQGDDTFPLQLTWGTFIWGNDLDEEGENLFSSYFELGYRLNIGNTPLNVFAGVTPWKSFYAPEFALVNVGLSTSRELKFNENFSLPLGGGLYFNPQSQKAYLVFTLTF